MGMVSRCGGLGSHFLADVLRYICSVGHTSQPENVVETIRINLPKEVIDMGSIAEFMKKEGRDEGLKEGRDEGLKEGRDEGRQEVILRLVDAGMELETLVRMLDPTPAELAAIRKHTGN